MIAVTMQCFYSLDVGETDNFSSKHLAKAMHRYTSETNVMSARTSFTHVSHNTSNWWYELIPYRTSTVFVKKTCIDPYMKFLCRICDQGLKLVNNVV